MSAFQRSREARADMQPVVVEITQHHPFESKGKGTRGCGVCGEAKTHPDHLGAPPSLNVLGSGNQFAFQAHKKAWQELLVEQIEMAGLPKRLAHILVEGECTFPDRRRRDQGNHRFMIEKALGDALQAGGWLEDDDWGSYEFGGLAAVYEKGVSRTRLMLFPRASEHEEMAA